MIIMKERIKKVLIAFLIVACTVFAVVPIHVGRARRIETIETVTAVSILGHYLQLSDRDRLLFLAERVASQTDDPELKKIFHTIRKGKGRR